MIAKSGREAWRATAGDCQTPGRVERSTDRGKTWKRTARIELAPIVRLGIDPGGHVYTVAGGGQNCSTRYVAFSNDGIIVGQTTNPRNVWFQHPADRDRVYGPANTKHSPCGKHHVVGLAALDPFDALLICTDGSAMATSNSGRSWTKADDLPGTEAVGAGGGHYLTAGTTDDCDGLSVKALTVNGGKIARGANSCAPAFTDIAAGEVAIDASGKAIWVWAGNKVRTSDDGGRTWT